jgi:hypothetical protein
MRRTLRSVVHVLAAIGAAFPLSASAQTAQTPAVHPGGASTNQTGPSAADDSGPRWKLRFYGFAEFDAIHDSTQSLFEASLNAPIMPRGTYLGDNGRTQFTAKNSRIGLLVAAPSYHGIETSASINFDFFGLQPTEATENDFYVVGTMRLRHAFLRLRTPVVDFMAGQAPTLFGWGGAGFYPGTVAFLGTVGQVYHHDAQARLSKTLGETFQVETAAAVVRPAQRDAEVPDIEAGIRLAHNGWRARTIQGNDRPEVIPFSVGVSGLWRHFAVTEYREIPRRPRKTIGWGMVANALVPVLPASNEADFSNCLTLTAEFSIGTGVADRYSFLTGGARFPALPNPSGLAIPPLFVPNIDSGLVTYDSEENLKTIDWRGLVLGAQYYLPITVFRLWVTGLYAQVESDNLKDLTPLMNHGGIFTKSTYVEGSLFVGITPDVHIGGSLQVTEQERANGTKPRNTRIHVATNLFF